ncbi:hypothetical protein C8Q74DRAFT_697766 [Fomes fomentarius]|nr:hypothetical protein C8Q74DRAFT_697766 [Fomes fomentarius]
MQSGASVLIDLLLNIFLGLCVLVHPCMQSRRILSCPLRISTPLHTPLRTPAYVRSHSNIALYCAQYTHTQANRAICVFRHAFPPFLRPIPARLPRSSRARACARSRYFTVRVHDAMRRCRAPPLHPLPYLPQRIEGEKANRNDARQHGSGSVSAHDSADVRPCDRFAQSPAKTKTKNQEEPRGLALADSGTCALGFGAASNLLSIHTYTCSLRLQNTQVTLSLPDADAQKARRRYPVVQSSSASQGWKPIFLASREPGRRAAV